MAVFERAIVGLGSGTALRSARWVVEWASILGTSGGFVAARR